MEAVRRLGDGAGRSTAGALVRLARPHQWVKNLLVLAALVFARRLLEPRSEVFAILGFAAFCALASFAYAVNDIMDREADRLNPEKRDRPLARGDLSVAAAAVFAAGAAAFAAALSAVLGPMFLLIAVLYVALQFGYSFWAKRIVVLDVIAVAIGFVLRAFAGGVAIGVEVSPWLVFITFSLALFLALARRRHELSMLGGGAAAHRGALAQYSIRLIDQMLSILAGATLVGYMIYCASSDVGAKLGTRYQYVTVPYVAFGILWYLYIVDARDEGGDPARVLLGSPPLLIALGLWMATEVALLYF